MSAQDLPPVPYKTPLTGESGLLTQQWMAWFRQLFTRVGGNITTLLSNPMTTLGDLIYGGASGVVTRVAGSTSATKKFLVQTGTGTESAAPTWAAIVAGDVPTLNQNTSGTAASVTGTNVVTNANLSQMAANTLKGNNIGSTANAADLTVQQALSMLLPAGIVSDHAGSSAPTGWLLCDGSAVSRTTYAALFAAIGATWGSGDGSTTFNVPDARGRASIGVGTGSGLTARALAATGGEETHTLSSAEMPTHTHTQDAHNHFETSSTAYSSGSTIINNSGLTAAQRVSNGSAVTLDTTATNQNTGGGGSHNNMQPFIAFNRIIKT